MDRNRSELEEELKKEHEKGMDRKRSGKKLTVGEEDVADVVAVLDENPGQHA